jgi:hypothetical protein
MGEGNLTPKRVVWRRSQRLCLGFWQGKAVVLTSRLRCVALRSIRGIMRHCSIASRLLRYVLPVPALPDVYI